MENCKSSSSHDQKTVEASSDVAEDLGQLNLDEEIDLADSPEQTADQRAEIQKGESKMEKKMLRTWKDVARRARIFEYCKVEDPNAAASVSSPQEEAPAASKEVWDDKDNKTEDDASSIPSPARPRRPSLANPFNMPHKPIEQIELLKEEVNLERQSTHEQKVHPKRSPSSSFSVKHPNLELVTDTILEETENDIFKEEEKQQPLTAPLFQRLSLLGDNVSGVRILIWPSPIRIPHCWVIWEDALQEFLL